MTEKERAAELARRAPKLNAAEREKINNLFPTYLFRRSKTGEIWTTCCRRNEVIQGRGLTDAERVVMSVTHQRESRTRWSKPLSSHSLCPYCGRVGVVKELGRTGHRDNLTTYRRVAVLRWYRGALWCVCYDCVKHYPTEASLTDLPGGKAVAVYRFKPGLAESTLRSWWGEEPFIRYSRQSGGLIHGKWEIQEPFCYSSEYGMGYDVIGLEEINKSPFRYCMAAEYEKKYPDFMRFLTACCFYPRQIEMLMKAKMNGVVSDLVARGVKNADAMKWEETDPKKAFGLNGKELKDFLETKRNIRTVALYKKLGRKLSMKEVAEWVERIYKPEEVLREAKKWGLEPVKLLRYLEGTGMEISVAYRSWKDYVDAAEKEGYPLHRENVLLPKPLGEAHDKATKKHRNRLERERRARAREYEKSRKEQERLEALAYQDRRKELERKYAISMDGYVIRVPEKREDIVAEGRALQHCVAGYADRHIRGATTILFLRREKKPNKPWLTIEMKGNSLEQIHGYKNEGIHSVKGRFAPDPREEHRAFLDLWLEWIKKGSRRDKDGKPKLPKKIKKEAHVA